MDIAVKIHTPRQLRRSWCSRPALGLGRDEQYFWELLQRDAAASAPVTSGAGCLPGGI